MAKIPHHPAAVTVVGSAKRFDKVGRQQAGRALAVLHEIATEGERRGMVVDAAEHRPRDMMLRLDLGSRVYEVGIRESARYSTGLVGDLQLWLRGPGIEYNGVRYYETKTIRILDRISALFDAIDAAQPVQDRKEKLWQEANEQRARDQAAQKDRQRADQLRLARERRLAETYDRWIRARDLRLYIHELEARVSSFDGAQLNRANEWLDWVHAFVEKLDPVNDEIFLPQDIT